MTISNIVNQVSYNGNDVTTVFAYPFRILANTQLDVRIADADGVETLLALTTNYTVSDVGEDDGDVTTEDLTAVVGQPNLPTGYKLVITRELPLTQDTDLENQGPYFAQTVEDLSDKLTMIAQQLQEELDRCPKVDITSDLTGDDLIAAIEQAVVDAEAAAAAASVSETNAATSETNAGTSETNAATSETNAGTSETNAATSETNAQTAETNAETAETNAAASEAAASTSEGNAATSETNAGTSETNAATSETNAQTAETNAETAETNAAASAVAAASDASDASDSADAAAASVAAANLPGDISGGAGKVLKVNPGETGYDLVTPQDLPTIQAGDAGKVAIVNEAEDAYELGTIAGGGGGGSDLDGALFAAETGIVRYNKSTTLTDTYNTTPKGILTDTEASANALRLSPGETSGDYTREKPTSGIMSQVETRVVYNGQFFKPDDAAVVANAFVLAPLGDYTAYFPATKKIMICKLIESEGQTVLQHLLDDDGNPAHLVVASTSYSSGTDKTTINITNPQTLDLDMGITSDWATQLRIVPVDLVIKACADTTPTYETLPMTHASNYNGGQIGIPGEGFFTVELNALTGSCLKSDTVYSPNRVYGYRRLLESRSGNEYFVMKFTSDSGNTFDYFGGSKANSEIDINIAQTNEFGGSFHHANRSQIVISDDGKFFVSHPYYGGSKWEVHARKGDLSDSADTDKAINHSDHLTATTGSGAGIILLSGATSLYGQVAADLDDLSYVAVLVKGANGIAQVASFDTGGSNFLGISAGNSSFEYIYCAAFEVSFKPGSGTVHRTHGVKRNNSNGYLYDFYVDEDAPTVITMPGSIVSANIQQIDSIITPNYHIIFYKDDGSVSVYFQYKTIATNAWSSYQVLSDFASVDKYQGWSSGTDQNFPKSYHQKIVVDESDDKHVLFIQECSDEGGSYIAPILYEVEDITSYVGKTVSQATQNAEYSFNTSANDQWAAQTFTAVTTKIETAVLRVYQNGTIPLGYTWWCELHPTAAGVPDTSGAAIATSRALDPKKLSTGSARQYIRFNFSKSVTLVASTVYALVIKTDFPLTPSANIAFGGASGGSAYTGGSYFEYNGSVWTNQNVDLVFFITDHKMTDVGNAIPASGHMDQSFNFEASIKSIDATNVQLVFRKGYVANDTTYFPLAGHPYRLVVPITAGGGVECDTTGALVPIAFNETFEPGLIFNASLGDPVNASVYDVNNINTETLPFSNRVGVPIDTAVTGATSLVDADFESGYCGNFADDQYLTVGQNNVDTSIFKILDRDMAFEIELKLGAALGVTRSLLGWYYLPASPYYGFMYRINSLNNAAEFNCFNGGNTTSYSKRATDKAEPTGYYKLRYTRKNSINKIWRAETTPFTTFTEVGSYDSAGVSDADSLDIISASSSTQGRVAGSSSSGTTQSLIGKIGYIKLKVVDRGTLDEADPFAVNGFQDQSAIVDLQNHGHRITGENVTGDTDDGMVRNFDRVVDTTSQESALVDSYTQTLTHKNLALTNVGENLNKKIEIGRGTTDHKNSIEGDIFVFDQ